MSPVERLARALLEVQTGITSKEDVSEFWKERLIDAQAMFTVDPTFFQQPHEYVGDPDPEIGSCYHECGLPKNDPAHEDTK